MEARFKERRCETSYMSELENRKLASKEKISEYVADIKKLVRKGYPTADELTFKLKFLTESRLNERLSESEGKITSVLEQKMEEVRIRIRIVYW